MAGELMADAEIFRSVIRYCQAGFQGYDRGYYPMIAQLLKQATPGPLVDKMLRFAETGPELVSPRFAYPHIEGIAKEALTQTPGT